MADALEFDRNHRQYATMGAVPDAFPREELSVALSVQTTHRRGYTAMVSYAVPAQANEFLLDRPHAMRIWIGGTVVSTGLDVADGELHRLVITWRSADARTVIYVDGAQAWTGTLQAQPIRPGGCLVIGQEQDEVGGGFDCTQAFRGTLERIGFWDRVLTAEDAIGLTRARPEQPDGLPVLRVTPDNMTLVGLTEPLGTEIQLIPSDWRRAEIPTVSRMPLYALSVTFWMRTSDRERAGTLLSYAVRAIPGFREAHFEELTLRDCRDLRIFLDNVGENAGLDLADGQWRFVAFTWSAGSGFSAGPGRARVYLDGRAVWTRDAYWSGRSLWSGGRLVVGQDQDPVPVFSASSGFEESQAFVGSLAQVAIWDQALDASEVDELMQARLRGDEPGLALLVSSRTAQLHGTSWVDASFVFDRNAEQHAIIDPVPATFPTTALTVSLWLRTDDRSLNTTPVSYAVSGSSNEFSLYDCRSLQVCVRNSYVDTGVDLADGRWHFVALTWLAASGLARLHVDGVERWSGTVRAGSSVRGGGSFVVGQEQDSVGGLFDASQAFVGSIRQVAVWSAPLEAERLAEVMSGCIAGDEPDLVFVVDDQAAGTSEIDWQPSDALVLRGEAGYAAIPQVPSFPSTEASVSFWIRADPGAPGGTPFSYAVSTPDPEEASAASNELTLLRCSNLRVLVGDARADTGVDLADDRWHFVVFSWRSDGGAAALIVDGEERWSGNVAAGHVLRAGGYLVVGQEQDALGGGFEPGQAFAGQIRQVAVWNTVLKPERIWALASAQDVGGQADLAFVVSDRTAELHAVTWASGRPSLAEEAVNACIARQMGDFDVDLRVPVFGWDLMPVLLDGQLAEGGNLFTGSARIGAPFNVVVEPLTLYVAVDGEVKLSFCAPQSAGLAGSFTAAAAAAEHLGAFWAPIAAIGDVVASFLSDPQVILSSAGGVDTDYGTYVAGLNLFNAVDLDRMVGLVDPDGRLGGLASAVGLNLSELDTTMGIGVGAGAQMLSATLALDDTLFDVSVALPGLDRIALVWDYAYASMTWDGGDGASSFAIGVTLTLGDREMAMQGGYDVADGEATLSGRWEGIWADPFGFEGVTITRFGVEVPAAGGPPKLDGSLTLPKLGADADFTYAIDADEPLKTILRFALSGSQDVARLFGAVVHGAAPGLSTALTVARGLLTLEDVQIYIAPNGGWVALEPFDPGVIVQGRVEILDVLRGEVRCTAGIDGIHLRGSLDPISIESSGHEIISLSGLTAEFELGASGLSGSISGARLGLFGLLGGTVAAELGHGSLAISGRLDDLELGAGGQALVSLTGLQAHLELRGEQVSGHIEGRLSFFGQTIQGVRLDVRGSGASTKLQLQTTVLGSTFTLTVSADGVSVEWKQSVSYDFWIGEVSASASLEGALSPNPAAVGALEIGFGFEAFGIPYNETVSFRPSDSIEDMFVRAAESIFEDFNPIDAISDAIVSLFNGITDIVNDIVDAIFGTKDEGSKKGFVPLVSSAICWPHNNRYYFFDGQYDRFWQIQAKGRDVDKDYPQRSTSKWTHMPALSSANRLRNVLHLEIFTDNIDSDFWDLYRRYRDYDYGNPFSTDEQERVMETLPILASQHRNGLLVFGTTGTAPVARIADEYGSTVAFRIDGRAVDRLPEYHCSVMWKGLGTYVFHGNGLCTRYRTVYDPELGGGAYDMRAVEGPRTVQSVFGWKPSVFTTVPQCAVNSKDHQYLYFFDVVRDRYIKWSVESRCIVKTGGTSISGSWI